MLEPAEVSVLVRIIYLFLVMSANRGVESPNPASAGFAM